MTELGHSPVDGPRRVERFVTLAGRRSRLTVPGSDPLADPKWREVAPLAPIPEVTLLERHGASGMPVWPRSLLLFYLHARRRSLAMQRGWQRAAGLSKRASAEAGSRLRSETLDGTLHPVFGVISGRSEPLPARAIAASGSSRAAVLAPGRRIAAQGKQSQLPDQPRSFRAVEGRGSREGAVVRSDRAPRRSQTTSASHPSRTATTSFLADNTDIDLPSRARAFARSVAEHPLERPEHLPEELAEVAREIAGDARSVMMTRGAATRRALGAARARAAATGDTLHLPVKPDTSPRNVGMVAHELTHVAQSRDTAELPASARRLEDQARQVASGVTRAAREPERVAGAGVDDLPVAGAPASQPPRTPDVARTPASTGPVPVPYPNVGVAPETSSAPVEEQVAHTPGAGSLPEATPRREPADGERAPSDPDAFIDSVWERIQDRVLAEMERRGGRYSEVF